MQTPAWELALNRREEALRQIRDDNDFCMAVVTMEDGLTLVHSSKKSLNFPEYTCGPGSITSETTATLLAVARFGEPAELNSYLKYCRGGLRATREGHRVTLDVQSVYTPSAT